jgi:hypothetical protein
MVLTTVTHRSQIEAKNKKQDKRIANFNPKGSFEIERNQLIKTRGSNGFKKIKRPFYPSILY